MMAIKIVSINLWHGGKLMPQIIDFIKSEDPDIIAMQEVYQADEPDLAGRFRSVETLQSSLDYPYSDFAFAYKYKLPEGIIPEGNAVISKFPILRSESTVFNGSDREIYNDIPDDWPIVPRILQEVSVQASGGKLNVFNLQGVWDLDGDNYSDGRKHMRDVILEQTAGKPNVIVLGDTNAKASNQAMLDLEKQLKSVYGQELTTTFNMRRKDNPGYATAAVDLAYVSPDIEILSKDVPDVDISDHLPLVITLQIPTS